MFSFFKKTFIPFFAIILTTQLAIAESTDTMNWQCTTEPLSTSILSEQVDGKVKMHFLHHNGVEFSPIYNGLITSYDIEYLKSISQEIKKLGNIYTIDFAFKDCKYYGKWKWSCVNNQPQIVGGETIASAFLSISKGQDEVYNQIFHTVTIRLSLIVNNQSISIPMQYEESQCQLK